MDNNPPPIIRAITHQMETTGISLLQLSKDADIPRSTLQRRLRTGRGLQLEEINRIAAALGTTASQIITQAEAAYPPPKEPPCATPPPSAPSQKHPPS